jgi:hypothetical protein
MLSNITTRLFHGIVVQIGYIKNKMLNNLTSQYNPHVKPYMPKHNNKITVNRNVIKYYNTIVPWYCGSDWLY